MSSINFLHIKTSFAKKQEKQLIRLQNSSPALLQQGTDTHIPTRTHTHTSTLTPTHTDTYTETYTNTPTHTQSHLHIYTHAHTHRHTYTTTHSQTQTRTDTPDRPNARFDCGSSSFVGRCGFSLVHEQWLTLRISHYNTNLQPLDNGQGGGRPLKLRIAVVWTYPTIFHQYISSEMPLFKHSDKSSFGLDIKFLHNSS